MLGQWAGSQAPTSARCPAKVSRRRRELVNSDTTVPTVLTARGASRNADQMWRETKKQTLMTIST